MVNLLLYGVLLLGIASTNLFFALKFLRDQKYAENYIKTSPKAWIWRKMLGIERAIKLTKKFFAPLGIVISIGMYILGFYLLYLNFF